MKLHVNIEEEIWAIWVVFAINRNKKKILDIIIIGETTDITHIGHIAHFYNLQHGKRDGSIEGVDEIAHMTHIIWQNSQFNADSLV